MSAFNKRQEQRDQDGDDGDDHQQLDEREGVANLELVALHIGSGNVH